MPRNRRPVDRAEKRGEIVAAATTWFTETGYDESSMSKIAASAGVTPTTIYWYFADKDALLVAVLDGLLAEAMSDLATRANDAFVDQAMWAVERLERYANLVTVVHARAPVSASVDSWHNDFHALADAFLAESLAKAGVAEDDLKAVVRTSVFVVEGLLTHSVPLPERRRIFETIARTH